MVFPDVLSDEDIQTTESIESNDSNIHEKNNQTIIDVKQVDKSTYFHHIKDVDVIVAKLSKEKKMLQDNLTRYTNHFVHTTDLGVKKEGGNNTTKYS